MTDETDVKPMDPPDLEKKVADIERRFDMVIRALDKMTGVLEHQTAIIASLKQGRDEGMTHDDNRRLDRDAIERQLGEVQASLEVIQRQMQVILPRMSAAENSCRRLEIGAKHLELITAGDIMKALAQTPIGKLASDRQAAIDKEHALTTERSAANARGLSLEEYRRDRAERAQTKQARIGAEQARIANMAPKGLHLPMAQILNGEKHEPFGEDLDD
jgi:chromosome segregation ATPase